MNAEHPSQLSEQLLRVELNEDESLKNFQLPLMKTAKGEEFYLSPEEYTKISYQTDDNGNRVNPNINEQLFLDEDCLELYEQTLRDLLTYMPENERVLRVQNGNSKKISKEKGPFDYLRLRNDLSDGNGASNKTGFRYEDINAPQGILEELIVNKKNSLRKGVASFRSACEEIMKKEITEKGVQKLENLVGQTGEKVNECTTDQTASEELKDHSDRVLGNAVPRGRKHKPYDKLRNRE